MQQVAGVELGADGGILVSPLTLLRGRGATVEPRRNRPARDGLHVSPWVTRTRERVGALPQTARPALDALLAAPRRVWLSELMATLCVVGGFIAAPLLTVLAWAGLLMPSGTLLHRGAETLFVVAIIWLGLALVSAHMHHHRHTLIED
jgi:hypothetical protein